MLTFTDLANRVNEIKAYAHDPERAHSLEDNLYRDFIKSIATGGHGELSDKATVVLLTQEVAFPRWCA